MKIRLSIFAGLGILCAFLVSPASAQTFKPGTPIAIQLLTPLDTGTAQAGQEFSATLAQPLAVVRTVWPKGTQVKGKVIDVVSSGRLNRPASITLQITQIGNSPVITEPEQIDGKSHAGRNAGLIVGGAVAGAILGGVAGGGKGAVIGTAAGAGAGTLAAAATGKQEIVLRAETPLNFVVAGGPAAAPPPPPPAPVAEAPQPAYRVSDERSERVDAPPAREDSAYRDRAYEDRNRGYDDRGRGYDDRDRGYSDHPQRFRLFFSDRDAHVIREYFRSDERGRRMARRDDDLPPGLEKRLYRGGTLPEGLERRSEPFPGELERRLDPLPGGYSRVLLSGRAMILRDDGDIVDMIFIHE